MLDNLENVGVIIAWFIMLSLAPLKSLLHSVAAGELPESVRTGYDLSGPGVRERLQLA